MQNVYRFATPHDEALGRTVWERTAADRFADQLHNLRDKARKASGSEDATVWKVHCPGQMRKAIWEGLCDRWAAPVWRNRSTAASANRGKVPDASIHTGGSISFASHKKKMVCI